MKQAEQLLPEKVRDRIPDAVESTAAVLLAFGYGMTFGSLYAGTRPRGGNIWLDGAALGAATWAAGYVGWLPAARLTPPVWKQSPKQVFPNLVSHVAFGIATAGLFKWAKDKWL